MNGSNDKKDKVGSSLQSMYSTIEEANAELQRRWNDIGLKTKVEKFLG